MDYASKNRNLIMIMHSVYNFVLLGMHVSYTSIYKSHTSV